MLIETYLDVPGKIASMVTRPMPNNTRGNLLIDLVAEKEQRPGLAEAVGFFQTCFVVCLENRNTIIHSLGAAEDFDLNRPVAFIREAKRPHQKPITIPGDATLIAAVAKEAAQIFSFGTELWLCVCQGSKRPLPDRPPQPRKLTETHR